MYFYIAKNILNIFFLGHSYLETIWSFQVCIEGLWQDWWRSIWVNSVLLLRGGSPVSSTPGPWVMTFSSPAGGMGIIPGLVWVLSHVTSNSLGRFSPWAFAVPHTGAHPYSAKDSSDLQYSFWASRSSCCLPCGRYAVLVSLDSQLCLPNSGKLSGSTETPPSATAGKCSRDRKYGQPRGARFVSQLSGITAGYPRSWAIFCLLFEYFSWELKSSSYNSVLVRMKTSWLAFQGKSLRYTVFSMVVSILKAL